MVSYTDAMAFKNVVKERWNNHGELVEWKVNSALCNLAREYMGNYNWAGHRSFKRGVWDEIEGYRPEFWGKTLHDLGSNEDEIFSFFTEKMESETEYDFKNGGSLNEFWLRDFREQLLVLDAKRWSLVSDQDLLKAFYWAVANSMRGLLLEVQVKDGLSALYADRPDVRVEWASDSLEKSDVDLVIYKDDKVVHYVSVKTGGAFTRSCIVDKYRESYKKVKPTMYVDEFLNRVFFRDGLLSAAVFEFGGSDVVDKLKHTWGFGTFGVKHRLGGLVTPVSGAVSKPKTLSDNELAKMMNAYA